MTKEQVSLLQIGAIVRNCLGGLEQLTQIHDGTMYELHWVNNGELSKGCELLVPSHFASYDLIKNGKGVI